MNKKINIQKNINIRKLIIIINNYKGQKKVQKRAIQT